MNAPLQKIREGFPKQRLLVIPDNVRSRCRQLPLVKQLYVTDIGSYPSAPHHYVDRKEGIPQAILIYCQSGKGSLNLGQRNHTIQTGHIAIIPPNTPHSYCADDQDPWSIFWIHFNGEQTNEVLKSLNLNAHAPLLYLPDNRLMRSIFEDIHSCLNYNYSDAGLLAMSSDLIRLVSKIKLHQGHREAQKQSVEKRVMDTLHFMEKHIDMPLTLQELATHSGQSIPYYSKLFKARTNQSPMSYYIQLKIRKACEMLDQTKLSITEISQKLGYEDPYYFSRLFKKTQGCSPSHYRSVVKG